MSKGSERNMSRQPFPTKIQVEVTSRCNMRCAMCVKTQPDSDIPEKDISLEDFTKLGPALSRCEALVLNGIGEPLLHPNLPEMAAFARERMPEQGWIGFQTNGLLVTESLAESLVASGVDTVCISVDSLESSSKCELHGQSDIDRLELAFQRLNGASRKLGRPVRLGVEFVLMADTVAQLPEVIRWAGEQGAEFAVVSHLLAYDAAMQDQSLFNPNTPEATALFNKWQAKAVEQGLDLHEQYGVAWKFIKSERERRLHELVKGLQKDASEQGVWVHLPNLLEWDRRNRDGAEERLLSIFRETERVAAGCSIDLRMPPVKARDERHCHFVEDGVAFITSEGDISPCQFLWHKYVCHLDGAEKSIKPWTFGNIGNRELGEVWRDAAYSNFRAEVLQYEYPYCSNCPFVPCDDIVGKAYDFDFDCLGIAIPCGHCLWCMGGLQCLL